MSTHGTQAPPTKPSSGPPPLPPAPVVPEHLQVRFPPELLNADPAIAAQAFARAVRGFGRRLATDDLKRRFAMLADTPLYEAIDETVMDAYHGLHPKHWVTDYHAFFVDRVHAGETAIDLGCGVGMVAASIAEKAGGKGGTVRVVGLDWSEHNLGMARRVAADRGLADRLTYLYGDICEVKAPLPSTGRFDAIVLSNVLEHVTDRAARLRKWTSWYNPRRVLIRVPAIDRNWQTALKRELGIDHRSDPTHETEYTEEQLRREVAQAGLVVREMISRWGEYWTCAEPG